MTYSLVFQKTKWKEFIDSLPYEAEFFLKDRFLKKYTSGLYPQFPAVFIEDDSVAGKLRCLLTAEKINGAKSLEELMELVKQAFEKEV